MDFSNRRYSKPKVLKKRKDLNKYKLRNVSSDKFGENPPVSRDQPVSISKCTSTKTGPAISRINRTERLTVQRGLFQKSKKSKLAYRNQVNWSEQRALLNEDLNALIPSGNDNEASSPYLYEQNNNVPSASSPTVEVILETIPSSDDKPSPPTNPAPKLVSSKLKRSRRSVSPTSKLASSNHSRSRPVSPTSKPTSSNHNRAPRAVSPTHKPASSNHNRAPRAISSASKRTLSNYNRSLRTSWSLCDLDLGSQNSPDPYPRTRAYVNAQRERVAKFGAKAFEVSSESEEVDCADDVEASVSPGKPKPELISKYIELISNVEKNFIQVKNEVFKNAPCRDYFRKLRKELWDTYQRCSRENQPEDSSDVQNNSRLKSRSMISHEQDNSSTRRPSISHEEDNSSLRRHLTSHEQDNSSLRRPPTSHEEDNSSLRRHLTSHEEDNSSLRRHLTSHEQDNSSLRRSMTSHEGDCSSLRRSLTSHEQDNSSLRRRLTSHKEDSSYHRNRSQAGAVLCSTRHDDCDNVSLSSGFSQDSRMGGNLEQEQSEFVFSPNLSVSKSPRRSSSTGSLLPHHVGACGSEIKRAHHLRENDSSSYDDTGWRLGGYSHYTTDDRTRYHGNQSRVHYSPVLSGGSDPTRKQRVRSPDPEPFSAKRFRYSSYHSGGSGHRRGYDSNPRTSACREADFHRYSGRDGASHVLSPNSRLRDGFDPGRHEFRMSRPNVITLGPDDTDDEDPPIRFYPRKLF